MSGPNLDTCANPACGVEFKRLGEGKLFAHPLNKAEDGKLQATAWLCRECYEKHTMAFDETLQAFRLQSRASAA